VTVAQTLPNVKAFPAEWRRSSEKLWLPAWKAWNEDPIATSADQAPVMPFYEPVAIAVYHIIKFKDYSDAAYANEIDALNSDAWRGFQPHQAWISEIHSNGTETIGDSDGERVHYVVRCTNKVDGWRFLHPDIGYVYKDGADIKTFLTDDDMPYIGTLDGTGGKGTTLLINRQETKKTLAFGGISGLNG